MDIIKVLQGGNVQRYHANPGISKQLNSAHQWRVTLLLLHIFPEVSKETILGALTHDCAEIVTGDLPATLKWDNPEIKNYIRDIETRVESDMGIIFTTSQSDVQKIKMCDMLEGMTYCIDCLESGEHNVAKPFTKWSEYVIKHELFENQQVRELYYYLQGKFTGLIRRT